jgi:glutamate-ammonia-ligase adenylyltransferase
VISGDSDLAARCTATLREILTRPRDPAKLIDDVATMRRRMAQQHPTDHLWDLKHLAGGLVDIEFIAQYLMLRHAAEHPDLLSASTDGALVALGQAGVLPAATVIPLREALRLWRNLHGFLRITVGSRFDEATLSPSIARRLAEIGGSVDFAALKRHMIEKAAEARHLYRGIVDSEEEIVP